MKILAALLIGLVIGICLGWILARSRYHVEPNIGLARNSNFASVRLAHGTSMLEVLECHDKVVRHGVDTLLFPKEVESLFGATNIDHFISNFGSRTETPEWNSVGYFQGRYVLSLHVPISIDYEQCRVKGAINSAEVQINEVTKVEISASGIADAHMKGQWRLNENEWKWLVKNDGDWSLMKVPILTNSPIQGFDEYVRQAREPIRDRKEGFDKPVRQALDALRKEPATNVNKSATK